MKRKDQGNIEYVEKDILLLNLSPGVLSLCKRLQCI